MDAFTSAILSIFLFSDRGMPTVLCLQGARRDTKEIIDVEDQDQILKNLLKISILFSLFFYENDKLL